MLVGCFCEDIGVKPAQVTEALAKDKGTQKSDVEKVGLPRTGFQKRTFTSAIQITNCHKPTNDKLFC